jgi:hypothetical protein
MRLKESEDLIENDLKQKTERTEWYLRKREQSADILLKWRAEMVEENLNEKVRCREKCLKMESEFVEEKLKWRTEWTNQLVKEKEEHLEKVQRKVDEKEVCLLLYWGTTRQFLLSKALFRAWHREECQPFDALLVAQTLYQHPAVGKPDSPAAKILQCARENFGSIDDKALGEEIAKLYRKLSAMKLPDPSDLIGPDHVDHYVLREKPAHLSEAEHGFIVSIAKTIFNVTPPPPSLW